MSGVSSIKHKRIVIDRNSPTAKSATDLFAFLSKTSAASKKIPFECLEQEEAFLEMVLSKKQSPAQICTLIQLRRQFLRDFMLTDFQTALYFLRHAGGFAHLNDEQRRSVLLEKKISRCEQKHSNVLSLPVGHKGQPYYWRVPPIETGVVLNKAKIQAALQRWRQKISSSRLPRTFLNALYQWVECVPPDKCSYDRLFVNTDVVEWLGGRGTLWSNGLQLAELELQTARTAHNLKVLIDAFEPLFGIAATFCSPDDV